jgi:hypothetical protein
VPTVDYTSCATLVTGDTCTPVCKAGFTKIGTRKGFVLTCNPEGEHNAAIQNIEFACSESPTKPISDTSTTVISRLHNAAARLALAIATVGDRKRRIA